MDDKELECRFAQAGKRYGFKDVRAEFAAFRDFKLKWSATGSL